MLNLDFSDKDLLKFAAKAVSAEYEITNKGDFELVTPIGGVTGYWNPLTNDGDALRLMAALPSGVKLTIIKDHRGEDYAQVNSGFDTSGELIYAQELLGQDSQAAVRKAIVKAAVNLHISRSGSAKP